MGGGAVDIFNERGAEVAAGAQGDAHERGGHQYIKNITIYCI